ncbi:MAG: hypothetical protein JXA03_08120 [Bacteroidales bacterium]|nr:hypothetical protein [Bacteroidales bacterium]
MEPVQTTIIIDYPEGAHKPLGFRIMKAAYDCNVKGWCRYDGHHVFLILAEGMDQDIRTFHGSLRGLMPGASIRSGQFGQNPGAGFTEFDIIRCNHSLSIDNHL